MAGVNNPSPPTLALFFETVNAYQRTASLKAAIELDVFTGIGEGKHAAGELADRCQTSERGMRILCDYMVIIGFLTKTGSRYELTPDTAKFIDRNSKAFLGGAIEFMLSPLLTDSFRDVAAVVRKGGTVQPEDGLMAPENPEWVKFARAMAPMMALPAELIAELVDAKSSAKWKVLDIAAGHGLFGVAIGKHNPNAEIVALDWPNVLEVAVENAEAAGISDRYRTIRGSAFDADYGGSYDIVLLTNFLHHFDAPTCEGLLRKVHSALLPGGRAVTLEFIPDEDRVSPPLVAAFSMMMLGGTAGGDAYTFSELDRMFLNAGFASNELRSIDPSLQQVVVSAR